LHGNIQFTQQHNSLNKQHNYVHITEVLIHSTVA